MSIVSLLSSLNKIGLVAFLITLGFLIYEIILLRRASRAKARPRVPQFQEGGQFVRPNVIVVEDGEQNATRKNKYVLIILVVFLIFFGVITLISYINLRSKKVISRDIKAAVPVSTTKTPTPTVKKPTPTSDMASLKEETPTPIEEALSPTETPSASVDSPTPVETSIPTLSPTIIKQLPQTGFVNNSLILFSVAGLFLLFSLLF